MSGLYIEMVWNYNDAEWESYIKWIKFVKQKQSVNIKPTTEKKYSEKDVTKFLNHFENELFQKFYPYTKYSDRVEFKNNWIENTLKTNV